jgi:N-acetylglucosamine malate deacetylase 1
MRVLVVAPHPDDESIGCGGAILRHVARGDEVRVAFLTSGELALKHLERDEAWRIREQEAEDAGAVLGLAGQEFLRQPDWFMSERPDEVKGIVAGLLERHGPGRVYVTHGAEWHPDHRVAFEATRAAATAAGMPYWSLFAYEVWTPLPKFDDVEDIGAEIERKLEAVGRYRSQCEALDYVQAVRGLNSYRGALAAGCDYAEVFGCPELNGTEAGG